jgi:hypothetical protein
MSSFWWAGSKVDNQGVSAWSFGLVEEQLLGCSTGNAADLRCIYPDVYSHTFNASLTYACPTLLSLPHYYKASSLPSPFSPLIGEAEKALHRCARGGLFSQGCLLLGELTWLKRPPVAVCAGRPRPGIFDGL